MAGWLEEYLISPEDESLQTPTPPISFVGSLVAATVGVYGYVKIYIGATAGTLAAAADCDWDIYGADLRWISTAISLAAFSNGDTVYWAAYYSVAGVDYYVGTDVYSFTLGVPPNKPTTPGPTDADTGIKRGLDLLTWEAG